MPKLNKITTNNYKKIDISEFIPPDEGEESTFVTIKKIPCNIQKKIEFQSLSSYTTDIGKNVLKKMKKINNKRDENKNLTDAQALKILDSSNLLSEEIDFLNMTTTMTEKLYIENGLCKDNHNLFDNDGKLLNLDYEIINSIGIKGLIDLLVMEIKNLSLGISLGE